MRKIRDFYVQPQSTSFDCSNCLEPAKLQCSRCHSVKYCSSACQKENWKQHKEYYNCIKKFYTVTKFEALKIVDICNVCKAQMKIYFNNF